MAFYIHCFFYIHEFGVSEILYLGFEMLTDLVDRTVVQTWQCRLNFSRITNIVGGNFRDYQKGGWTCFKCYQQGVWKYFNSINVLEMLQRLPTWWLKMYKATNMVEMF